MDAAVRIYNIFSWGKIYVIHRIRDNFLQLTEGAQQWADESAQNLLSASSCENEEFGECSNFTELYAMRRATRSKMAVGKAAAEWLWKTWFTDAGADGETPIPQNVLINIMGLGLSYVTAPDKSNHVYAVARFAEVDPDTYFQDKKLHEIIYFPDEVDITKTYNDTYDYSKTPKHEASKGRGVGRNKMMRRKFRKHQTKNSGEDQDDAKSEE